MTELNTKEELLVDDILKDFSYKAIYTAGKRAQNEIAKIRLLKDLNKRWP